MEDRAELLQRRIAAYRRHLAEGADLELARCGFRLNPATRSDVKAAGVPI